MPKVLMADGTKCTGCRYCEVACSFRHTGRSSYEASLIQALRDDKENLYTLIFCWQCEKPRCVKACPQGAVMREDSGKVLIDPARCTGCSSCPGICPFLIPKVDPQRRVARICDLCDGEPACVRFCATGALQYVDAREAPRRRLLIKDRAMREMAQRQREGW